MNDDNALREYPLIHLESVDSTNWEMRRKLDAGTVENGTMIVADYQSKGHGRLGREWKSSSGSSLLFSVWASMRAPVSVLPGYSLLPALAVTDVLLRLGVNAGCKWPNDIRVRGRKLCGILTECILEENGAVRGAVVGIGMNLRGAPDLVNNGLAPVYLSQLTETLPGTENLARMIAGALIERTSRWIEGVRMPQLEEWKSRCDHLNALVTATVNGVKTEGRTVGIGNDGSLLLEKNGELLTVTSDDIVPVSE